MGSGSQRSWLKLVLSRFRSAEGSQAMPKVSCKIPWSPYLKELGSQRSTNVEDSLEKKEIDKRRRKGSSNTSLSLLLVFLTGNTI